MTVPFPETYRTRAGVRVRRIREDVDGAHAVDQLVRDLDSRRGALLASSYEYPGRYTRWDMGFVDPPLELVCSGRKVWARALNARGQVLLPALEDVFEGSSSIESWEGAGSELCGSIKAPSAAFLEEERSRQPSIFGLLRDVIDAFHSDEDTGLGLYGAFGYDLSFQFEPVELKRPRPAGHRDLVLYLPDELVVVDHMRVVAQRIRYDFEVKGRSTVGVPRAGAREEYTPGVAVERECDHAPGAYEQVVRQAREAFARGDLFEVVPGQTFFRSCPSLPSQLFELLRSTNPAPYGFLFNLGEKEYLVGASPEMFVRVHGERVETCPISGTIARGSDAIGDARQILELLNSNKDASELTMCTDVDRNDKSRVCRPESVRVIGRRQIELYSRLIHTVDHVEGMLRPGFDALDAFVSHTWAVTVTGAPKQWAMQFIEDHEQSPRAWYGGAVGKLGFDGSMNTGLTLRTIRLAQGVAQVRAGATLLYDSDPEAEERETRLKASALLDAIKASQSPSIRPPRADAETGEGKKVLLIDHQDSFVHTLAGYFRRTGAEVSTVRYGFDPTLLDKLEPGLVVLSPGPGRPSNFDTRGTIEQLMARKLPIFGVCLGLQALVEFFGGELGTLDYPMHGKPSRVSVRGGKLFPGCHDPFVAGRYHSLYARSVPSELNVTAFTEDPEIVMAVEHSTLPVAAVQFHPESILTADGETGFRIVSNVMRHLAR